MTLLWQYAVRRGGQTGTCTLGAASPTTVAVQAPDRFMLLDTTTGRVRRTIALPHALTTFAVPPGRPQRFLTQRYQRVPKSDLPVEDWLRAPQLLEAWDDSPLSGNSPAWSVLTVTSAVVGDGDLVVWQNGDNSVTGADQSTGRMRLRLAPEVAGEPIAVIAGHVFLRVEQNQGISAQYLRVVNAASDRTLGFYKYDSSESSLFRTPGFLLGPNGLALISEVNSGVGVEDYRVCAYDLARGRLVWAKPDLEAIALAGDTLLCNGKTRDRAMGAFGLEMNTGRVRWKTSLPYRILGIHNGLGLALTVLEEDNRGGQKAELSGIRPADGKPLWSFSLATGAQVLDTRLAGDRMIVMRGPESSAGVIILEAYRLP